MLKISVLTRRFAMTLSACVSVGKPRLETMTQIIQGLLVSRTTNLSHVATRFEGEASVPSAYRRIQRFFTEVRLPEDWACQLIVNLLKPGER